MKNYHGTQHIEVFFVFACAAIIFAKKSGLQKPKISPKWQFLNFKPTLVAIFVTIATVKVK